MISKQNRLVNCLLIISITILAFFNESLQAKILFDITIATIIISIYFVNIYIRQYKLKFYEYLFYVLNILLVFITQRINLIAPSLIYMLYQQLAYRNTKTVVRTYVICFMYSGIFASLIIFFMYLLGHNIEYDNYIFRSISNTYVYRRSLGFTHPNQAMIRYLTIIMSIILISKRKLSFVALMLLSYFLYYIVQSRTTFYILLFVLTIFVIFPKKLLTKDFSGYILLVLPVFFLVISFFLVKMGEVNYSIDQFFSGRPRILSSYIANYGFSVFGNTSLENQIIDNSYIYILLAKGFLFTTLYSIVILVILYTKNRVQFRYIILISIIFTLGLMEVIILKFDIIVLLILVSLSYKTNSDLKGNYDVNISYNTSL